MSSNGRNQRLEEAEEIGQEIATMDDNQRKAVILFAIGYLSQDDAWPKVRRAFEVATGKRENNHEVFRSIDRKGH